MIETEGRLLRLSGRTFAQVVRAGARAASHLDDHNRKLVQTLCQRHGVTLE